MLYGRQYEWMQKSYGITLFSVWEMGHRDEFCEYSGFQNLN